MPAKRKNEKILGQYFAWLLGRRNGIYFADGRSNHLSVGRHSLGTSDRGEALQLLTRLDAVKAVETAKAPRTILQDLEGVLLPLEEGNRLYLQHVQRPSVLGGASPATAKRYRAVMQKFLPFAEKEGLRHWQPVSKKVLEAYGAWLDDQGYAYATEYLELTLLKQMIKWLVAEKKIPTTCLFQLPLRKPQGTFTYCYSPEEVRAMIAHCFERKELIWLGQIIVALACTGLRIGELAQLRRIDLEMVAGVIRLTDSSRYACRAERATARRTKSHRDRCLPIHPNLRQVLEGIAPHADGLVFHGPLGGRLKPDTVRTVLTREVLTPLAKQFPETSNEKGFRDGRLHSFRHYFCSTSANCGVPEQVLMSWLGHRDSKMVKHYYHLHQEEGQRQMAKIAFVGDPPVLAGATREKEASPACTGKNDSKRFSGRALSSRYDKGSGPQLAR